jgi:hypothetical protein
MALPLTHRLASAGGTFAETLDALAVSSNALSMISATPHALGPQALERIVAAHFDFDAAVANVVGWLFALKAAGEPELAAELGRQLTAALEGCANVVRAVLDRHSIAPLSQGGAR